MMERFPHFRLDASISPMGLTEGEALRQRASDGPNELPTQKARSLPALIKEGLLEPMTLLLIVCGGLYFLLGDQGEALLMLAFFSLIMVINVVQQRKMDRALSTLRSLSSPRALVIRDGQKKRIPGCDVVRGDLVIVAEGDRIPADGWLLHGTNVAIDESMLTGESESVQKSPLNWSDPLPSALPLETQVFAGTTVVKGTGLLGITAIGRHTELGKIGKLLLEASAGPTPLELETENLVKKTAVFAAFFCLVVAVSSGLYKNDLLSGALSGITLAMAILPNELPAVLGAFLALGAWRLSKVRVLSRKSSAVEALGAANVLCIDKTGTLTYNRMALRRLYVDGQVLDLKGDPVRDLPEDFHQLLEFGILAGEKDPVDPMELALKQIGHEFLANTEHLHSDWILTKHYPITHQLLALSYVWKGGQEKTLAVAAKGAPEAIFDLCHLSGPDLDRLTQASHAMAQDGLRTIAVAKAVCPEKGLPDHQHDFDFQMVGLLGLEDPIRTGVPQAIKECYSAGIRVIMITGDHPKTACSIARQIHLPGADQYLTGDDLRTLEPEVLTQRLATTNVFARVSPEQKLLLVQRLKAQGALVAMTGDGVNDAPALKSAHIGIAMGKRGTDVAREAADLVLLDDDFASIVSGIKMGRRVYANLQSAISYLFTIHLPIAGIAVVPALFNTPSILMPIHVALLHLVIEPACSIGFETSPAAEGLMSKPPRGAKERLFSSAGLLPAIVKGLCILITMLGIAALAQSQELGAEVARTLDFLALMAANLGLLLWSPMRRVFRQDTPHEEGHWQSRGVLVVSVVLPLLVVAQPDLRSLLRFGVPSLEATALCVALGLCSSLGPSALIAMIGERQRRPRSS